MSCSSTEEEEIKLVSKIDGEAYINDMKGDMSARKVARLVLEKKADSLVFEQNVLFDLADSIVLSDSTWRPHYFMALNNYVNELSVKEEGYVGTSVFTYFIHYPVEFLGYFENDIGENQDKWWELLSKEMNSILVSKEKSSTEMVNLALKNCIDCSLENEELITQFILLLESYTI